MRIYRNLVAVLLTSGCASAQNSTANSTSSANSSSSSADIPALPPTGEGSLKPFALATNSSSFVTARSGKLYLDGQDYTFSTFNNPNVFSLDDYELEDVFSGLTAFARPVTRTYTLGVVSVNVKNESAFVQGWSNETRDWVYNEDMFSHSDAVLFYARKWGCKITVPIINQDYGSQESNFNGNWADLIRLYYDLPDYNATLSYDFWTDPNLINATKKLYTKFLTRNNTLTGVVYGQDNSFWAIETGNELNQNMTPGATTDLPAPGNWTVEIAQHIKNLAPNILVMDGSLSRNNQTSKKWAQEALQSSAVDLFSYAVLSGSDHYYDVENGQLPFYDMPADAAYITSYGKTFIAGEFGFFPWITQWDYFYQLFNSNPVAGCMAWSTRGHSHLGGFITHGEGNGIFSYHFPGWSPQTAADFDPLSQDIVGTTYVNSYTVQSQYPPGYPVPGAPQILPANTTSTGNGSVTVLPFRGAAWAEHYEVFRANASAVGFNGTAGWMQVSNNLRDNVDAGQANFSVSAAGFGDGNGSWVMRGVSSQLQKGPWSNIFTIP